MFKKILDLFKRQKPRARVDAPARDAKFHGDNNFQAYWLSLKGAPQRRLPGQRYLVPHEWPDKDKYGMTKAGCIVRRTPKIPYRVRRWRKRAAARIAKQQGHTLEYARSIVQNLERGIVSNMVKTKKGQTA